MGLYAEEESLDDNNDSKTYLINHMRNQLSFDLWYIFLGVFCICVAESDRIMSKQDWVGISFSFAALLLHEERRRANRIYI